MKECIAEGELTVILSFFWWLAQARDGGRDWRTTHFIYKAKSCARLLFL